MERDLAPRLHRKLRLLPQQFHVIAHKPAKPTAEVGGFCEDNLKWHMNYSGLTHPKKMKAGSLTVTCQRKTIRQSPIIRHVISFIFVKLIWRKRLQRIRRSRCVRAPRHELRLGRDVRL